MSWGVCRQNIPHLSVMFWECLEYEGVGSLAPVEGNINSRKYIDVLHANFWLVIQKIPEGRAYIFQEDNATERPLNGKLQTISQQ